MNSEGHYVIFLNNIIILGLEFDYKSKLTVPHFSPHDTIPITKGIFRKMRLLSLSVLKVDQTHSKIKAYLKTV